MTDLFQGDIININGFKDHFLIISNNAFIRAANVFHVCPFLKDVAPGPLHIQSVGINGTSGTAICEQIKLIDPAARGCHRVDRLTYASVMDISDALQGIFEYD
jgi:mRNA-degrading endonuclease toxin of MazEF toxin-antitoxin module